MPNTKKSLKKLTKALKIFEPGMPEGTSVKMKIKEKWLASVIIPHRTG
jgi:hypothetical protein